MIAVLLILIPLLTGLLAFFSRNEKLVRSWALFSSILTLAISILGLTIFSEAKYLEHQSAWMSTLGKSWARFIQNFRWARVAFMEFSK